MLLILHIRLMLEVMRCFCAILVLLLLLSCKSSEMDEIHVQYSCNGPPELSQQLDGEEIEFLLKGAVDKKGSIKWLWLERILDYGDQPEVKEALIEQTESCSNYSLMANIALFMLGEDPDARFDSILSILDDVENPQRGEAIIWIGNILVYDEERGFEPDIIRDSENSYYIERLLNYINSSDPEIRVVVLNTISRYPYTPGTIDALFNACTDSNENVRRTAALSLEMIVGYDPAYLCEGQINSIVIQLLDDADASVRVAGCDLAEHYVNDPLILDALDNNASYDEDWRVRCAALSALVEGLGSTQAMNFVERSINDANPEVRNLAVEVKRAEHNYIITRRIKVSLLIILIAAMGLLLILKSLMVVKRTI